MIKNTMSALAAFLMVSAVADTRAETVTQESCTSTSNESHVRAEDNPSGNFFHIARDRGS
jgi:hypothetical protein